MDSPLSPRTFAANVLGTTTTPDTARPSRLPLRIRWLRRKFSPSPSPPPFFDYEPSFTWDIPNPFASPLPRPADAIQTRIERERRYESFGPLDPVHYYDFDPGYDLEEDDCDDLDDDEESYDSDSDGGDADDEEEDCDPDVAATEGGRSPIGRPLMPIALPQLLHDVPLCFITPPSIDVSNAPSEAETRVPSPPTLLLYPSSESESETETECGSEHSDKEEPSWADLAAIYNDLAEAEERAIRKARRNAQRSRSKVLAILGPEASSAL